MSETKIKNRFFLLLRVPHAPAAGLCLAAFVIFSYLVVVKYNRLGFYDWDLAFFSQSCWNLLHGSPYSSLAGINFFGDHSYYIIFFLLPFFALVSHPLTLVFFVILAHILGGFLLYRVALEDLGKEVSLLLMTAFFLLPANIFSIVYGFNTESLSPVFLVLMYIFFKQRKFKNFWIAAFFVLLIKENMALVLIAYGLWGLASKEKDRVRWGIVPLAVGLLTFFVLVKFLIPLALNGEPHAFIRRYTHMGSSLGEIFLFIAAHPLKVLGMIFEHRNLQYLFQLSGLWLWPAVFSPQIVFLAFPLLLQHLLSNVWSEHTVFYHYGSSLAPFIFLAVINTLTFVKKKVNKTVIRILVFFLCAAAVVHLWVFKDEIARRVWVKGSDSATAPWALIREIPRQAGVVATFNFLTSLSLRKNLYSFHVFYDESFHDKEKASRNTLYREAFIKFPREADYALIDFDDLWLRNRLEKNRDEVAARIRQFLEAKGWSVKKTLGSVVLFERSGKFP